MWRRFLNRDIRCGMNGALSNLRRMIVKKNPNIFESRSWSTELVRLWWLLLLALLFLIMFSSTGYGQASISGCAWMDVNKDGLRGESERGFSGVRVQLFRQVAGTSYEALTSLRTQSDGSFLFLVSGSLLPESFYLQFEKVPGMYFSLPRTGGDNLSDSEVDTSSGRTPIFNLVSQDNATGWNAGYMSSPLVVPEIKPAANLVLNVAVSNDSAHVGEYVDFTIDVTNSGPDASLSPHLVMQLAPNLLFVSATPLPAAPDGNPLEWALETLVMNEMRRVTVRTLVIDEGEATGTIYLLTTTEETDQADNSYQYLLHDGVPVELTEFIAHFNGRGILLRWVTASETENFGFQLFRAEAADGYYEKITPAIIEGAGTSASEHQYEYLDADVAAGTTYYYKLMDVDYSGQMAWHGPVTAVANQPAAYALAQNYPNPFNSQTRIRFTVGEPAHAELTIYNQLGQKVRSLFAQEWPAGQHEVVWDGTDEFNLPVASGLYIYLFRAGDYYEKKIMNLIK